MKVLHVLTWLNFGGIEKWIMSMLKEMRSSECEMDVCCKGPHPGAMAEEAVRMNAKVLHCPLGLNPFRFVSSLRHWIRTGNYAIVHNHLQSHSGLVCLAARGTGAAVITSFHNTSFAPQAWPSWLGPRTVRSIYSKVNVSYALRASAAVTGCSADVLEAIVGDARVQNRRVLHYGIELSEMLDNGEPARLRAEWGIPSSAKVVIHVGRFAPQKNHGAILEIFKHVRAKVPDAVLLLVGDGPLRRDIEGRIDKLFPEGSVYFLGTQSDVRRLLAMSDVFLFPSLHEGFPVAALEASATGLPIIGSDIPGLREAVINEEAGLLFGVEDVEGMSNAVVELLRNKDYAAHLGINGRRRVGEEFSIKAAARKLSQIYNECCRVS